jgi:dihydropteroate synthase
MTNIFGVVNVTPDSFSDGGDYASVDAAIAHGRELLNCGADVLDIGGESTRPGAARISAQTEISRIRDVVATLAHEAVVSVDTIHAETARAVLAAGAHIINDVSGGLNDASMFGVVAEANAEIVIGHWRGIPDPQHTRSDYEDVVSEVNAHLLERVEAAVRAGIQREKIILDPGLGFDKTGPQCWEILRRVDQMMALGYRVLIGASRKRLLKDVLEAIGAPENMPKDRDLVTSVVSALCDERNVWGVRVHDVAGSAQALAVSRAWRTGDPEQRNESWRSQRPQREASAGAQPVGVDENGDHILLRGLEVFAHHGVFGFERERGQRFIIDAKVSGNLATAGASDDLRDTVHYGELADALVAATKREPVALIETLAERLASTVLAFPGAEQTTITVHKPDAPIDAQFADVSVSITRRADG